MWKNTINISCIGAKVDTNISLGASANAGISVNINKDIKLTIYK